MQDSPPYRPVDDDEIDLIDLIRKIRDFIKHAWKEQRYIWYCLAITIPLGLLIAFGSTEEYTASTKILPYKSGGAASSSLAGLAGLAGIRLPEGATDQIIPAELYPEVANTLDFRVGIAETPVRYATYNRKASYITFTDSLFVPSLMDNLVTYTIGLPMLFVKWIKPQRQEMVFRGDDGPFLQKYSEEYLKKIEGLSSRMTVSMDATTGIMTISVELPDPYAAADMVNAISEKLMQSIISYEIRKVNEQLAFVEEQHEKSRQRFEAAQEALATFTDRNRGTLSATAQIEAQRLQSEYNLAFEIYRNFATELEQARIKQNQDTPIFTILQQVTVPPKPSSPNKPLVLILMGFLGGFAGLGWIAWRQFAPTLLHT